MISNCIQNEDLYQILHSKLSLIILQRIYSHLIKYFCLDNLVENDNDTPNCILITFFIITMKLAKIGLHKKF